MAAAPVLASCGPTPALSQCRTRLVALVCGKSLDSLRNPVLHFYTANLREVELCAADNAPAPGAAIGPCREAAFGPPRGPHPKAVESSSRRPLLYRGSLATGENVDERDRINRMSDRLTVAHAFKDAGMSRDKAEHVASAIFEAIRGNVATKTDVDMAVRREPAVTRAASPPRYLMSRLDGGRPRRPRGAPGRAGLGQDRRRGYRARGHGPRRAAPISADRTAAPLRGRMRL